MTEHLNTNNVTIIKFRKIQKLKKTKTMDRNKMKKNAEKVMEVMKAGYRYTLSKLQEITAFGTTDLCMAILLLIRNDKVKQFQCEEGVCYVLTKA
jgi:hypothetical protein